MITYTFREYDEDRIVIRDIVDCIDLKSPIKLNKFHLIFVETGEITIDVNHRIFNLSRHSSLHLNNGDTIRSIKTSKIIRGIHMIFSPSFQNEIRTTRKSPISIQLKKEFPAQFFSEEEYRFLADSINRLKKYISYTTHYCQPIVVKNAVHNLLLDISDRRRKDHGDRMNNATHKEVILERFRSLVNGHCNEYHSVNWYADALMITPDYLSKIIRESEGKSARDLINERIVSNAKFMMRQSDISIKEISEKLHFPDQSSFGRFFKANTGQSPKEYRKKLAEKE